MLDNTFSETPLEYLEPIFIVLFSFLAVYVLAVFISVGLRLRKSLKNKKNLNKVVKKNNNKIVKKDYNKKVQNFNEIKNIGKTNIGKEINKVNLKESLNSSFEKILKSVKRRSIIFNEKFIKRPLMYAKKILLIIAVFLKELWVKAKLYYNKLYRLIRAKLPVFKAKISKKFKTLIKSLKDFIDNRRNLD